MRKLLTSVVLVLLTSVGPAWGQTSTDVGPIPPSALHRVDVRPPEAVRRPLPSKPEPPRPQLWSYFVPSVGLQDGRPAVSVSLSQMTQAVFAYRQFQYANRLREWQEERDVRRVELEALTSTQALESAELELKKAVHDSLYAARSLEIAAIRFERGELTDEQVLSVQNAMFQAAWTCERLRMQIRHRRESLSASVPR